MKYIIKSLLLLALTSAFFSCTKDENQVIFEGGTKPVLSSSTATVPMSFVNKDKPAITISWTNPNYMFNTGLSSQDVSYLVEIDTVGSTFTNPQRQSITVIKDMNVTLTQGELNGYLLNQLLLKADMNHEIAMRVTASLGGNTCLLYTSRCV